MWAEIVIVVGDCNGIGIVLLKCEGPTVLVVGRELSP